MDVRASAETCMIFRLSIDFDCSHAGAWERSKSSPNRWRFPETCRSAFWDENDGSPTAMAETNEKLTPSRLSFYQLMNNKLPVCDKILERIWRDRLFLRLDMLLLLYHFAILRMMVIASCRSDFVAIFLKCLRRVFSSGEVSGASSSATEFCSMAKNEEIGT